MYSAYNTQIQTYTESTEVQNPRRFVSQNHVVLSDKDALCACATKLIIGRGPATR